LVLIQIHKKDAFLSAWKVWRPLKYIGSRSYSIYLVHASLVIPIANWMLRHHFDTPLSTLLLTVPVCVVASIAIAEVFYRTVEAPIVLRSRKVQPTQS